MKNSLPRSRVDFKRLLESTELTEFSDMFGLFLRTLYKREIAYIQKDRYSHVFNSIVMSTIIIINSTIDLIFFTPPKNPP